MSRLPRWAENLKQRHPDGEMPSRQNPIPAWLEAEARKEPLWYVIREAKEARTEPPYLVRKEIRNQPSQWAEILTGYGEKVDLVAEAVARRKIRRVIFTGCGSAFFTALHGAFVFPRLSPIENVSAIESFELASYFPAGPTDDLLVIGHSGTGGSIETVQAMAEARKRGALTLAITNTEDTPVGRASELVLTYVTHQECGPCISVVSTRIVLQTMLALAMAKRVEAQATPALDLSRVSRAGTALLDALEPAIEALVSTFVDADSFFIVGSGPNYYSAREGTLKIEEQAILVGKAYRTGDFLHDALSLIGPDKPVFFIEAAGTVNDRIVDSLRAARAAGSPTIAVTWSGKHSELADLADHALELPVGVGELESPIPLTLVFQLIGYHLGVQRGYNPDTLRTDHWPNAKAWLTAFPLGTH